LEKKFSDENPINFIQETISKLRLGSMDDQLIYSKTTESPLGFLLLNINRLHVERCHDSQKRAEQGLPLNTKKDESVCICLSAIPAWCLMEVRKT